MGDWIPKPPRLAGDVLYSESWFDFLLLSRTGNRWLLVLLLSFLVVLALGLAWMRRGKKGPS